MVLSQIAEAKKGLNTALTTLDSWTQENSQRARGNEECFCDKDDPPIERLWRFLLGRAGLQFSSPGRRTEEDQ